MPNPFEPKLLMKSLNTPPNLSLKLILIQMRLLPNKMLTTLVPSFSTVSNSLNKEMLLPWVLPTISILLSTESSHSKNCTYSNKKVEKTTSAENEIKTQKNRLKIFKHFNFLLFFINIP
jgi:hypothetical protein